MTSSEVTTGGVDEAETALEMALENAERARSLLETKLASVNSRGAWDSKPSPEEVSLDSLSQALRRARKRVSTMTERR